jgi:hypothetical protein
LARDKASSRRIRCVIANEGETWRLHLLVDPVDYQEEAK